MPLILNLRHLQKRSLDLEGELPAEELELSVDEMIEVSEPIRYQLAAERLSQSILIQGRLECQLDCHCVRCLRPFVHPLELDPWVCDLPLEGEDKVEIDNDCVDLTPYIREDILLAFPQHPLCEPDCRGLTDRNLRETTSLKEPANGASAAWAELNKLKF